MRRAEVLVSTSARKHVDVRWRKLQYKFYADNKVEEVIAEEALLLYRHAPYRGFDVAFVEHNERAYVVLLGEVPCKTAHLMRYYLMHCTATEDSEESTLLTVIESKRDSAVREVSLTVPVSGVLDLDEVLEVITLLERFRALLRAEETVIRRTYMLDGEGALVVAYRHVHDTELIDAVRKLFTHRR